MGELIDLKEYKNERNNAEIEELKRRVTVIRAELGALTSGPLWLDPITGTIEQIIPGIEIS